MHWVQWCAVPMKQPPPPPLLDRTDSATLGIPVLPPPPSLFSLLHPRCSPSFNPPRFFFLHPPSSPLPPSLFSSSTLPVLLPPPTQFSFLHPPSSPLPPSLFFFLHPPSSPSSTLPVLLFHLPCSSSSTLPVLLFHLPCSSSSTLPVLPPPPSQLSFLHPSRSPSSTFPVLLLLHPPCVLLPPTSQFSFLHLPCSPPEPSLFSSSSTFPRWKDTGDENTRWGCLKIKTRTR